VKTSRENPPTEGPRVKILALDTATEVCSAALLLDGTLIGHERELGRGHAEYILPMIDELLREAALSLAELDAIAFGRGPGGFTGVRLAASVTQGLAFGSGLPVVPISDLRAVAQRVLDLEPSASRVLVCNDARMNEVYWGCFERDGEGLATHLGKERVAKPAAVALPAAWTSAADGRSVPSDGSPERGGRMAGGAGFAAYPDLRARLQAQVATIHDRLRPRAHEIARLAVAQVRSGRAVNPEEAIPVYLRDDVVQPRPPLT
jgi:tRNA threonylcarbamoyladenosine biosynthesis protein TsaB